MSFDLHGRNGDDLRVNRWNWFPTLALLGRVAGTLDHGHLRLVGEAVQAGRGQ